MVNTSPPPHDFRSQQAPRSLHASLAEPVELPAEEVVAVEEEETEDKLSGIELWNYVKRVQGGFVVERITTTGRA
jgi:hypothetical protein